MTEQHMLFQEDLAAYALGALDAEDTNALEAHLLGCDSCRTDLTEYRQVSTGLLAALPAQAPRPSVRAALAKRISGPARPAQPARPQPRWSFGQAATAGAFVLLLGLNAFSVIQIQALRQQQAELGRYYDAEQTAIAMLAYPTTQAVAFQQGEVSGSLLVDKKRDLLAVFVWNLPPPPAGKTYQLWLIDPQEDRTSGGFLAPEAGQPFTMKVFWTPKPLTGFVGMGVTVEPLGGSTKPTGERVLRVDF
jgi:anti-sigma-K factor RskA